MKLRLLSFGIAKDIMNGRKKEVDYPVHNIHELKSMLCSEFPEFVKLKSISFAVNEEYQEDVFILSEYDEVAIIPPVAGG